MNEFSIKDDDLLKKHDDVWNKICNSIEKEFDCELIYIYKAFENQNKVLRGWGNRFSKYTDPWNKL